MSESLDKKIEKMETILLHSLSGIHALFANHQIRQALWRAKPVPPTDCPQFKERSETLIRGLVERSTLSEKLAYLEQLDPESYSILVQVYLEIIEGALKSSHPHHNLH